MTIPRVVLDTNVVVSAALAANGLPARVLALVAQGNLSLYLSEPIIQEYITVLTRPKFAQLDRGRIRRPIGLLKRQGAFMVPRVAVSVCVDEDDNRFLECAQAARARYLITGNARHFPERWKTTRVVTPRQFFDAFDPGGALDE